MDIEKNAHNINAPSRYISITIIKRTNCVDPTGVLKDLKIY